MKKKWVIGWERMKPHLAIVLRRAGPPARAHWHGWHLALRRFVSQAGLWSIISLSNLALVQPERTTSCIPRNPSQLTESGTAEFQTSLHRGAGRLNTSLYRTQRWCLPAWHQYRSQRRICIWKQNCLGEGSWITKAIHRLPSKSIHLPKLPVLKDTK